MRSRAVRLTLVILLVAAAGATAYLVWNAEGRTRTAVTTARDFDAAVATASAATLELRASQQAYVAAGQGDEFWAEKVAAAVPQLTTGLERLRSIATALEAQTALDTASGLLRDFEQMDRRAREFTRNGQKLLASDLIFSDGLEMTGAITAALDAARRAEMELADQAAAGARRQQMLAVAAWGAFALLVALLLVPTDGRQAEMAQPARVQVAPVVAPVVADDTRDLGAALDRGAESVDSSPAAVDKAPPPVSVDLTSVAAVCTELARVVDTRSLPALLERTAAVLDASGIILWVADPDGRELTPIVAHGYPPQLVGRLGTLARDAENATAAAYRTGLLQTVKGDLTSKGAIAAPLLTPAGPVGVMSAEINGEGELGAAKLAAASIVAAQLATLVGPPARVQSKAEVAG